MATLNINSLMPFGIGYHRLISNVLKLKNLILFVLLAAGIGFSGKAQEMHGYVHSNYAGITGSLDRKSVV